MKRSSGSHETTKDLSFISLERVGGGEEQVKKYLKKYCKRHKPTGSRSLVNPKLPKEIWPSHIIIKLLKIKDKETIQKKPKPYPEEKNKSNDNDFSSETMKARKK